MAWLESHQSLQRHPKTYRLCRTLDITVPAAIGHLQCLWWWCMDYAPDGDLTEFDHDDIARASMWDGDADSFFDALLRCGFIDQQGNSVCVHDWDQYGGKLNESKERNRDRQRRFRERHRDESVPYNNDNGHVTDTSPLRNALEDRREENSTGEKRTEEKRREEVGLVVRALDIDQPTDRQVRNITDGVNDPKYVHLNGVMVAESYMRWQDKEPSKRRHKDRVGGFLNQLEMRREQPAYFREAAPSSNGASSNGKHEIASDGREYGTWLDPTYVRHDTPIPSDIPEVQTLFQTLKSFGTCSMREWDDLFSLNPQVRQDGTIIFRVPDEQAHEKVKRYCRDLESACRETDLRFEIGRDA